MNFSTSFKTWRSAFPLSVVLYVKQPLGPLTSVISPFSSNSETYLSNLKKFKFARYMILVLLHSFRAPARISEMTSIRLLRIISQPKSLVIALFRLILFLQRKFKFNITKLGKFKFQFKRMQKSPKQGEPISRWR